MYKFLLCWRYLCTRYIALASIISVMLGVATMIVVNAVMSGFTSEMQNRIHGILSDVVLESRSLNGFPNAQWHMDQIRKVAGDSIEAMTPTVAVPAMLRFRYGEEWITRQVQVIGIDEKTQGQVSDFSKYLQHMENRRQMSFQLRNGGYDTVDHQGGDDAIQRPQLAGAGWQRRREVAETRKFQQRFFQTEKGAAASPTTAAPAPQTVLAASATPSGAPASGLQPGAGAPANGASPVASHAAAAGGTTLNVPPQGQPADPFLKANVTPEKVFDPTKEQHPGLVMGIALVICRTHDGEDQFLAMPGDDVVLYYPRATDSASLEELKATSASYTIVDLYESKMSEYDSSFIFVPLEQLQDDRGMVDPTTKTRFVTSIQIKLKPDADGAAVRDRLAREFSPQLYVVQTWRDKQGALLSAVQMETTILNILLFLIIAVSGFGILAIFFMIVVEKTRDIGILKSLGAPGHGIMSIFLSYGLALGLVGSGMGMVIGLLIVQYINPIADFVGWLRGEKVFDPSIYYFYKIPAVKDPWTVAWIVCGALAIAVLASVLPALRAARLHPVEALRHE